MFLWQQKLLVKLIRQAANTSMPQSVLKPSKEPKVNKSEQIVDTSAGKTRLIVYEPERKNGEKLPVFINMHGGGFVMGSADMDDLWCPVIAERVNCVVVNVDYKLSPEYKFPIAINECYDILAWLYEHPEKLNIENERIAIGGHSAGGNLAAAVCLLNCQKQNPYPIVCQVLDYPPLDLYTDPARKPRFKEEIPPVMARIFNSCYVNNKKETLNPLVSPVFADSKMLEQLPPAVIITAELDSLIGDGEKYSQKLSDAGVTVTYKEYKNVPHGFTHMGDPAKAEDAWNFMSDALKEYFQVKPDEGNVFCNSQV